MIKILFLGLGFGRALFVLYRSTYNLLAVDCFCVDFVFSLHDIVIILYLIDIPFMFVEDVILVIAAGPRVVVSAISSM